MSTVLRKIGFLTALILPALVLLGFYSGGNWNFLTIIFSFIVIPVLDRLRGIEPINVPSSEVAHVSEERYYRFITYVWTFLQVTFVLWACFAITQFGQHDWVSRIAFTLSVALVTGGIGITVAHELGHKKSALERFYSKVLLMTVSYMHFYIEHNRGHHVSVATPEDPATAREGENFYAFWLRSVFLGYRHAWHLENERIKSQHKNILHNQLLGFTILPFVFCAVVTLGVSAFIGRPAWEVPVFFFAQSILAFTLLELVNYVEHYGIVRKKLDNGRYERVNPLHSWNASHLISNFFLFQLQRHSDHHAFAHKRYQVLDHYDESPQLPSGYPTMILLALVPPAWFAVMNSRLEKWRDVTIKDSQSLSKVS